MIPVIDLNQVNVAWIEIRGQGFVLYGFMLYSDQDTALVEFMHRQSGLAELDALSGPECAIFVIESPSRKWVEYARRHNHPWWQLFGSRAAQRSTHEEERHRPTGRVAEAVETLLQHQGSVLVAVDEHEPVTLRHLLQPDYGSLYDRTEIWEVVRHFGLTPQDIPCLVFFQDIDQGDIQVVSLRAIRSTRQATLTFRDFFAGPDFGRLIKEARGHA
jgi:hypothetical protein